jgi:hypothetical protein
VRSDLHGRYSSAYTYLAVAATVLSRDRCMDAGPGERAASVATTARDKPLDVTHRPGTHGALSATSSLTLFNPLHLHTTGSCFFSRIEAELW